MPSYNVTMAQGVTDRDLGDDSLVTGITSPDGRFVPFRALASCTGVVMTNSRTGAAGMFHFPAGDINRTDMGHIRESRRILTEMVEEVRPDQLHFGHGPGLQTGFNFGNMTDEWQLENANLRGFVRSLVPTEPGLHSKAYKVPAGALLVRRSDARTGQFTVDPRPYESNLEVANLSETREGQYERYRLYGITESAQTAIDEAVEQNYVESLSSSSDGSPISSVEELDLGARSVGGGSDRGAQGAGAVQDPTPLTQQVAAVEGARRRVHRRHLRPWLANASEQMTARLQRVRDRVRRDN